MSLSKLAEKVESDAADHNIRISCIWSGPSLLGECPIWDDRRQRLFWIDSLKQEIWEADADGQNARVHEMPDVVGSIGMCEDGRLIAGFARGFAFVDLGDDGADVDWIGNPEPELADTRLNDGKVDRQGRYWCGSMNVDFANANGSLYRLDSDLSWHRLDDKITVSNGIAFSPDGRTLYFSDSRVDRSYQYDLDPVSGEISNRRSFVDTTAYKGRIDGATVDREGNYWGALFEGAAVGCFSPRGELLRHITLPVRFPTMCAFGGADLDILYVTSATFTISTEDLASEPDSGALFAVHNLGVRGIAEPRFATK